MFAGRISVKYNYKWISFATLAAFLVRGSFWELSVTAGKSQEPAVRIEPRKTPSDSGLGSANRQIPTIRINSDLVLIPVMVTDRNDRAVTGLERSHFRLWEDKVEQTITQFSAEDVPISVVFAFDVSGSMGKKLGLARLAVDQFVNTANPEDEFALVSFNDQVRLVQPFTVNHEEIQSRMLMLAAKGRTALLDAIVLSMDQMKHAKHTRKVIVIVSDGGDNSSRYSVGEVRSRAREADVQIYSIGLEDPFWMRSQLIEQLTGAALLSDMASQTGGRLYEIEDANQLPDVTARIGAALRNQYVLGYVPSSDKRDGKYHRVQVKVQKPAGVAKLRASFRSGYTAASN
jgi:Ca-activated chloride channel family protein